MVMKKILLLFIFIIMASFVSAIDITNCTNLNTAGAFYNLTVDINNSANLTCINISNDNITLDCYGNNIDGNNSGSSYGIYARGNPTTAATSSSNITIQNCNITDWNVNVAFDRASNSTIKNITSSGSTHYGVQFTTVIGNILANSTLFDNGISGFGRWDFRITAASQIYCINYLLNVTGSNDLPIIMYSNEPVKFCAMQTVHLFVT
jgi:hypothetical protein